MFLSIGLILSVWMLLQQEYNMEHKSEYHDSQKREVKFKHLKGHISFLDDAETILYVLNNQLETVEFFSNLWS